MSSSSTTSTTKVSCSDMPLLVKDGDNTFKSPDGKLFTTNDGFVFTSKTTGAIAGSDGKILAIDDVNYRFNACS